MEFEKAGYSVYDIAAWFIQRNKQEEENGSEKITLLKLLKLLYYAEGCSLALKNKSLFNDDIVAWEHGPVVSGVYYTYNSDPYNLVLTDEQIKRLNNISSDDQKLLEDVFDVFGQYSAWALRNKTHNEKPWLEATKHGQKLKGKIDRNTMKQYFSDNYID